MGDVALADHGFTCNDQARMVLAEVNYNLKTIVTGFAKTVPNGTFSILRNTVLKY